MPIPQDIYNNVTLTAAINRAFFPPRLLAQLQSFGERGISTTDAFIEMSGQRLTLVPSAPRGGVAEPLLLEGRTGYPISTVHLPVRATVLAESSQNQRAFGRTDLESPQERVDRTISAMRSDLETTIENLRFGAIRGLVLDADGVTVLLDTYATFGIEQTVLSLGLSTPGSMLLTSVINAERASERALRGAVPSAFVALCASDFIDSLRSHPDYRNDLQYARPSELLKDYRNGITVGGVTFLEYLTPIGGVTQVEAGTAYLVPMGIPDLLITRFAPADYMETVNEIGLPLYCKSEPLPFNRGHTLEAQSNPISLCTNPASIIKLTL